jgi:hypothetical protein
MLSLGFYIRLYISILFTLKKGKRRRRRKKTRKEKESRDKKEKKTKEAYQSTRRRREKRWSTYPYKARTKRDGRQIYTKRCD